MAVRPIITDQEHRALRGKAKRVPRVDASLRKLIEDMVDTVRAAPGVGLAAPQVGVPLRVVVVDYEDRLYVVLNPEVVKMGQETVTDEEGCLSAPHWQGPVARATSLTVKGRDRDWKEVRIKAEGWLARIFQHELDHLEGILFLDKVEDRAQIRWVEPEADGEEVEGEAEDVVGVPDRRQQAGARTRARTRGSSGARGGRSMQEAEL
ncbi:MAG TPA: peptide deformylase [Chloroflexota bacterium]|nr:peptide deformylase [Chloroflexota bacterium]